MAEVAAFVGDTAFGLSQRTNPWRESLVVHAPKAARSQITAQERGSGPVPLRGQSSGAKDVEPRRRRVEQPHQGAAALASRPIKKPATRAGVLVFGFTPKINTKCPIARFVFSGLTLIFSWGWYVFFMDRFTA